MSSLKLIIFDCDGVMFDSKEANRQYYNSLLIKFGHPLMDKDELQYVHAHHVTDSVRYIYRNHMENYESAELYRQGLDYGPFLKYMKMEPDLLEFLGQLQSSYKTAISTNRSTTMDAVLDMFDLRKYFGKVVTALDVKRPKPHPEALYEIMDYFQCTPTECIYIGDSEIDVEHAGAAGIKMVAFKNQKLQADFHVNSFMEINSLPVWG